MIKKTVLSILLFLSLFNMTGCYDYKDIEESSLVAGIAIDKGAAGYEVTAEILSMKSQSSSEATPNPVVITKTGETVAGALEKIVSTNVRQLYFGHCAVVLLSKDVAEEGIRDFVDFFFHDNRINVSLDMVVVKQDKASDVFKCTPTRANLVSFDVSKALKETAKENSTTTSIKVYECINAMENPGGEAYLPSITFDDDNGEQRFSISGISVFKDDKLIGFLSEEESLYFLMLTDDLKDGSLEIEISEGNYLHFNILSDKIKVKPKKDNETQIGIDVKLSLSIMRIPEDINFQDSSTVKEYEDIIALKIKEKLQNCIQKIKVGYRSDILSYGYLLYKESPSVFRDVSSKNGEYIDALDFDIKVTVELQSSGLSDLPITDEE